MRECTIKAVEALLAADDSVSREVSTRVVEVMYGVGKSSEEAPDEPLSREEVARMLHVSKLTVTRWGMMGRIRRVSVPGRRKALGYSRKSVYAILNGDVGDGRGRDPGAGGGVPIQAGGKGVAR